MRTTEHPSAADAGFTLLELLVAMAITLVIMGGTLTVMNDGYRSAESATSILGLNNNLRIGVDLLVRDLIQVGQGLPSGRVIQVPSGNGALRIQRPHPSGSGCTQWPAGITSISAVTPGPGCGPIVDGVPTGMLTTLAVDSALEALPIWSFDLGAHSATVALPAQSPAGRDISVGGNDDIRVGDLMLFTKGSGSALVYVTAVNGGQTFTFNTGDPMNLNQFVAALNGTLDDLATAAPTTANSTLVSRVRMITYYLDITLDPTTPRLIRHMNWGDPLVAENRRGQTVAFAIENLQFTYDMLDGVTNPSNVRMVDADLTNAGACAPNPCSPLQIRKVNIFLAGRSAQRYSDTNRFFRTTLATQVSLRSLALVDRYR
jgi:prepilin-type N-terminal cleavage/methylation domain-containing protein